MFKRMIEIFFQFQDLDYQLVALRAECEGKEIFKKTHLSLNACANACRGISQMFMYGTNQFGVTRCYGDKGCDCYCEMATSNYECNKQLHHGGYNLYKYLGEWQEAWVGYLYQGFLLILTCKICESDSSVFPSKDMNLNFA